MTDPNIIHTNNDLEFPIGVFGVFRESADGRHEESLSNSMDINSTVNEMLFGIAEPNSISPLKISRANADLWNNLSANNEQIPIEKSSSLQFINNFTSTKPGTLSEITVETASSKMELNDEESLKDLLYKNAAKIKLMDEEIRMLKSVNESLIHMMDHWRTMLDNKLESMNSEMRTTFQDIKLEIEGAAKRKQSQSDENDILSTSISKTKLTEPRISLERKIAGIYTWNIDRVMEKRGKRGSIWSEFFYTRNNHYKMRLQFHPNGFVCTGTGLSIYLFLYPSETNSKGLWPFKADVTMTIVNKANPSKSKILTKYCHIEKPVINPFKCCASFDFIYQELYLEGLFQDDYFSIECFVNVR